MLIITNIIMIAAIDVSITFVTIFIYTHIMINMLRIFTLVFCWTATYWVVIMRASWIYVLLFCLQTNMQYFYEKREKINEKKAHTKFGIGNGMITIIKSMCACVDWCRNVSLVLLCFFYDFSRFLSVFGRKERPREQNWFFFSWRVCHNNLTKRFSVTSFSLFLWEKSEIFVVIIYHLGI